MRLILSLLPSRQISFALAGAPPAPSVKRPRVSGGGGLVYYTLLASTRPGHAGMLRATREFHPRPALTLSVHIICDSSPQSSALCRWIHPRAAAGARRQGNSDGTGIEGILARDTRHKPGMAADWTPRMNRGLCASSRCRPTKTLFANFHHRRVTTSLRRARRRDEAGKLAASPPPCFLPNHFSGYARYTSARSPGACLAVPGN